ncbi:MAG: hypothetical protein HN348_11955, partial [Proteobacteria bacterium]|nr:hypothetical protein [Pseudomonadota bacterium]
IMQNIIGVFRWRSVVRSRGGFYRDMAKALRELGEAGVPAGAPWAALAADALAQTVLTCHSTRLPREQHVMFELAHLMAEVETSVALCHKAARLADDDERAGLLLPAARLVAGAAAREVAVRGLEILVGSGRYDDEKLDEYRQLCAFSEILATSQGRLDDMAKVTQAIVGE